MRANRCVSAGGSRSQSVFEQEVSPVVWRQAGTHHVGVCLGLAPKYVDYGLVDLWTWIGTMWDTLWECALDWRPSMWIVNRSRPMAGAGGALCLALNLHHQALFALFVGCRGFISLSGFSFAEGRLNHTSSS